MYTDHFTGKARAYAAARPGYAQPLFSYLAAQGMTAGSRVADVGSGTGIFSKSLLDRGVEVYAVEPNDDMRAAAERLLSPCSKFHSIKGTAEHTGLPDHSVAFVTAAQSFHWFDPARFRAECRRILLPGGRVVLVWNRRSSASELNRAHARIFRRYCPDFHGFSAGIAENTQPIRRFFDDQYIKIEFDHPLTFDRDAFLDRSLSASYSLQSGDTQYDAYLAELAHLFDRYAKNGVCAVENTTVAYIGSLPFSTEAPALA